jgi:hypothetical protein
MPSEQARETVLASLADEPTSTSELYDRVGYPALVRAGLVSYHAFRDTLEALVAEGRASFATADDGATVWRRVPG